MNLKIFHKSRQPTCRGWNCLKYLKRGGTEKRGEETKILKRGAQLGQGVPEKGGLELPYELWVESRWKIP